MSLRAFLERRNKGWGGWVDRARSAGLASPHGGGSLYDQALCLLVLLEYWTG